MYERLKVNICLTIFPFLVLPELHLFDVTHQAELYFFPVIALTPYGL